MCLSPFSELVSASDCVVGSAPDEPNNTFMAMMVFVSTSSKNQIMARLRNKIT